MAKYILTIDQGTTGSTLSLITDRGRTKAKTNFEFRQIFPQPGWVEHNPQDIWHSVVKGIKDVLLKAKVSSKDLVTIGITNQRETIVAWDRKSGRPLGNAIVWQCRRTQPFCKKLQSSGADKVIFKKTGLVSDPYFSGSKMNWILKNYPKAKALSQQGNLCFGTIDTFLIWKLTQGETYATDVSNASRTMCLNLATLDYDDELLKIFGLKREMLPEVRTSAGDFGQCKGLRFLPDGLRITGVIGDQQAALFGQMAWKPGQSKITFGTGSFLLMNIGPKPKKSRHGLLTTVGWQLPGQPPVYALEGGAFICGAAVQWLRDQMQFFGDSREIEKRAKKAGESGGVLFVPSFAGLGAPHWDPAVRGTLLGLTRGTSVDNICYATLEAMAWQNVDIVETMKKDTGLKLKGVRVDGGASQNNLLMQLQANQLGTSVARPAVIESTTLGAAYLAGLGAGVWSSLKEIKKYDRIAKEWMPHGHSSDRFKKYSQWQKVIKNLQQIYN